MREILRIEDHITEYLAIVLSNEWIRERNLAGALVDGSVDLSVGRDGKKGAGSFYTVSVFVLSNECIRERNLEGVIVDSSLDLSVGRDSKDKALRL